MKIYTGGGDRGKTSLFSGERISKGDLRVEAYGDLDELNSVLGVVAGQLSDREDLKSELLRIQSDLFHLGAWLATTPNSPSVDMLQRIDQRGAEYLEAAIDRMATVVPPMKGFVLPGGHLSAAWAHVARTVCRRTERRVVALAEREKQSPFLAPILVYLNRLSDYLFMLARFCNHIHGQPDIPWNR